MKIWVIGSAGVVGSAFVQYCLKRGVPVLGTTKQEVDICSLDALHSFSSIIQPTHIINCAAYTDVDGAEKNPEIAFAVNAQGAKNCALAAQQIGAHLLHLSTDYIFSGTGKDTPYLETDMTSPINVYGKSKLEGEHCILSVNPTACIVRTSWVFGRKSKNLISSLLTRFSKEKELNVVSDQIGKPTYCFDLVEALFSLLNAKGIIHFANASESSRYQIALSLLGLARQYNLPLLCEKITPVFTSEFPTPAARPLYSALDTSKYTALTSIQPRPWMEAAKEFLTHE